MENEKHPLDDLKNDKITKKREKSHELLGLIFNLIYRGFLRFFGDKGCKGYRKKSQKAGEAFWREMRSVCSKAGGEQTVKCETGSDPNPNPDHSPSGAESLLRDTERVI